MNTLFAPHWRPTHDQSPELEVFRLWSPSWTKILNPAASHLERLWEVCPDTRVVLRNHPLSERKAEMVANPRGTGYEHAQWWDWWLQDQGIDRARVAAEGINEPDIFTPDAIPPVVEYNVEFIRKCALLGITPCAGQFNTGWPGNTGPETPPDWEPFRPMIDALRRHGGYLGTHEYWDRRGPNSDDWTWNPGRILQRPDWMKGIPILVTECGYDQHVNHGELPHHGWMGHKEADRYFYDELAWYERQMMQDPDVKGLFVFTHDFDHPWDTFDTRPLGQHFVKHAEWMRNQPEPEPPQPQPEPEPAERPHKIFLPDVSGGVSSSGSGQTNESTNEAMNKDFERAIAFVFNIEGGYSTDRGDAGNWTGCEPGKGQFKGTKYGISACSYPNEDIVNLTKERALELYRRDYWQRSGADKLPWPLSLVHLDSAVNHGVGAASGFLAKTRDPILYMAERIRYYTTVRRHDPDYGDRYWRAWMRRCADVLRVIAEG